MTNPDQKMRTEKEAGRKAAVLTLRLTVAELDEIRKSAGSAGVSVSNFVRARCAGSVKVWRYVRRRDLRSRLPNNLVTKQRDELAAERRLDPKGKSEARPRILLGIPRRCVFGGVG